MILHIKFLFSKSFEYHLGKYSLNPIKLGYNEGHMCEVGLEAQTKLYLTAHNEKL